MSYERKITGFTLAEALITLVVIGVIAALTVPALMVNTEQHEYKSALKKALASLNQVIEMNLALEGYGPIEIESGTGNDTMLKNDQSLYNFFRKRMNVVSTSSEYKGGSTTNVAFFTGDGMRYEFPAVPTLNGVTFGDQNGKCARYDAGEVEDQAGNMNNTPCLIIVDVNGERRPNPNGSGAYKVPAAVASRGKVLDVFPILVTDMNAFPFGVVAQRAIFKAD